MLVDLLRRPEFRLVTLTGTGGVGKTRLALAVASQVADAFPDGVWFVNLAHVRHPALVLPAIAAALGVPEAGDQADAEGLLAHVRLREMLLVLDNFEHVAEAAPLLVRLLTSAAGLNVLVTSRGALRVSGEHTLAVTPLDLPTTTRQGKAKSTATMAPDAALASPAVQLFVERARAVRAEFALDHKNATDVVRICERLDGLPLAIELAAARLAHLSPGELVDRLDQRLPILTGGARDLPDRLRTMRNAIAWSYDLLTPGEQEVLQRLAIFRGGFTLAGAEAVLGACQGDTPLSPSVLDSIASLVEKNLLRHAEGRSESSRYEMLAVVQEFALERLAESGETGIADAHASWCITMAERSWEDTWIGPTTKSRLDAMSDEHDNVRCALGWLEERDDPVRWLWLMANMCPFWYYRSHRTEGRQWLERGLAATADAVLPTRVRARALHGAALLSAGEPAAEPYLQASLPLWRELNDQWGIGATLVMLALSANNQGNYARAAALYEDALATFAPNNMIWVAVAQLGRGRVAIGTGKLDHAVSWLSAGLSFGRETGVPFIVGVALNRLALAALKGGDPVSSAPLLAEALDIWSAMQRQENLADCLAEVAMLAALTNHAAAARLWGSVASLNQIADHTFWFPESEDFRRTEAAVRERLGEDAFEREFAVGKALGRDEALAEASAVVASAESTVPRAPHRQTQFSLTPRESDVLRLLARRLTDREIAEALYISPKTAGYHVSNILGKLGVADRREAAALAVRLDLV